MKRYSLLVLPALLLLLLSAKRQKQPVFDLKYVEANMNYIPALSYHTGSADEDIPQPQNNPARIVTVNSFYMSRFEVTNGLYCYYLQQLRNTDQTAYAKALPDTLVWREKNLYNEPYVEYYLRHPAYANYPVVGVNYDQAIAFCTWLSKTYNALPDKKYQNAEFDLPNKYEWMGAAKGGLDLSPYPWGGPYLRNTKGQVLANFMMIDEGSVYRKVVPEINVLGDTVLNVYYVSGGGVDYMGMPGNLNEYADVTAPVNSYYPNDYGLYNMSGNVEEMIKDKGITKGGSWHDSGYYLRIETDETYTDSTAATSQRGFRIMMRTAGAGASK